MQLRVIVACLGKISVLKFKSNNAFKTSARAKLLSNNILAVKF